MFRSMLTLTALLALSIGNSVFAQQHMPRGTATDVTNDEIQATLAKTPTAAVSDQQIRVANVAGEYNVGVVGAGFMGAAIAEAQRQGRGA